MRTVKLFFKEPLSLCIATTNVWSPISPYLCLLISGFPHCSRSSACEVVFHYNIDLHFLNDQWWTPFCVLLGCFYILFVEMVIQVLYPFIIRLSSLCWVIRFLYLFHILNLIRYVICKYFSNSVGYFFNIPSNVFWCTKVFNFDEVQFIHFFFCCSCFQCQI